MSRDNFNKSIQIAHKRTKERNVRRNYFTIENNYFIY